MGGEKGTTHVKKRINRVKKWPTQEAETDEANAAWSKARGAVAAWRFRQAAFS